MLGTGKDHIMSDKNELSRTSEAGQLTGASASGTTSHGTEQRAALPAVDIFEDANGITLVADMPGVPRNRLDVQVHGDTLAIEGQMEVAAQPGMRAIWAEVSSSRYRRTFTLSRELDTTRIEANLKDGVLQLRIPKQPHAQPRRVAVEAG